jgi:hypothetical protein
VNILTDTESVREGQDVQHYRADINRLIRCAERKCGARKGREGRKRIDIKNKATDNKGITEGNSE